MKHYTIAEPHDNSEMKNNKNKYRGFDVILEIERPLPATEAITLIIPSTLAMLKPSRTDSRATNIDERTLLFARISA